MLGRDRPVGDYTKNLFGIGMDKRAAIYVRVSTDKQTIENQLRELRQIAERRAGRASASITMLE
jgi:predicted TIM-barrel fold metal-dependent hydrolase